MARAAPRGSEPSRGPRLTQCARRPDDLFGRLSLPKDHFGDALAQSPVGIDAAMVGVYKREDGSASDRFVDVDSARTHGFE